MLDKDEFTNRCKASGKELLTLYKKYDLVDEDICFRWEYKDFETIYVSVSRVEPLMFITYEAVGYKPVSMTAEWGNVPNREDSKTVCIVALAWLPDLRKQATPIT